MDGFLKQIATHLFELHGRQISELTIVFPNRRAGLFFKDYLNNLIKEPVWAPEIISINELFSSLSAVQLPDKLNLVFRLFRVYRDLTGTKESFDEFYFWGDMLVNDFDQVDKYLVDADALFTNIVDLKEIEERFSDYQTEEKEQLESFWKSLSNEDKSNQQNEFIRLWKDLKSIYHQFKNHLNQENMAYEGMLFRSVSEKLKNTDLQYIEGRSFVFAGFNALNRCEEELFLFLLEKNKARFFWDFDHYYFDDQNMEAGLFMRANLQKFPQSFFPYQTDLLLKSDKQMKIVSIPSQSGQAQVAARELITHGKDIQNFDDTALVLCDEELLLPVISSIPEQIDKINVTMGFPLRLTPLFSLINHLTELQKNCRFSDSDSLFYNKDVLKLINHQLIATIDPEICKKLSDSIITHNSVYLTTKELAVNDLFTLIFSKQSTVSELPDYFLNILKSIYNYWEINNTKENSTLYLEYIYQTYLSLNNLKDILFNQGTLIIGQKDFITKETFYRFIYQHLELLSIPFEGEPLSGLQVMGILETRTLDFRNIIFLSINEGIMPKTSASSSFIPYNLRRSFGLPTIEEQNAMYAYYFYRLLQRAENITFIYNSGTEGLFTGEKSRYLYQLQQESKFRIEEQCVTFNIGNTQNQTVTIEKDDIIMSSLSPYLNGTNSLSPSALDKYISCPLRFYFRYVAGLEEPEEITEEIDARIFGLLFHETMESLYKPLLNTTVNYDSLEAIVKNDEMINQTLTDSFRKIYFRSSDPNTVVNLSGRNWLVFKVVKKYVIGTITLDLKKTPFVLKGLETPLYTEVKMNNGLNIVRIGGIIDRVDLKDGETEILDYKTGATDLSFALLSDLFDKEKKNRNKAALQTMIYSYVKHRNSPNESTIRPGIYCLRKIFEENYSYLIKSKEDGNKPVNFPEKVNEFETLMVNTLEELFNRDIPFSQTTITENCQYCLYNSICKRQL